MPSGETAVIRLDRTIREAQKVLRNYVVAGRNTSADAVIERLLAILDDEDFVEFQKSLEGRSETETRKTAPEDPLPYR